MPSASVVVIAYNEENRIGPCLDALLTQETSIDYEVIVVDDGSRDDTVHVVEKLQVNHPNLRILSFPSNRGRGAARRAGQDVSSSPWIGFVDADVVVPSNWLDRCVEGLSSASGVSGIAQPDGDCAALWRISKATLRERLGSAEITGNNLLLSRDALNIVPFSSTARLGEDFRLAKAMNERGFVLRTLKDLKVEHRELKTYGQSMAWMWKSGVDATSLLTEFRIVRLPDVAWATWLACCATALAMAAAGILGIGEGVAIDIAMTLTVNAAFVISRFRILPHPLRFLAALVISPPLMLAYLCGRSAGLPLALVRIRQRV